MAKDKTPQAMANEAKSDPVNQMGEHIRRIVCTTADEAIARCEIERVIAETEREMKTPPFLPSAMIEAHRARLAG